MDTISGLPYELLVRILSLVPTKAAVSTCILSKRWKFLWMSLPKLDFTDRDESLLVLKDFINKNLPVTQSSGHRNLPSFLVRVKREKH
ncbi:hypothetical protein F2Q68_00016013 [Brassica cretica]|uniref:F-box domain-containing protein n=1 Tax=Brassica cretica TaxID=69181 RepID=A0A8S9HF80_BRACR|nr:hypothetical protein F2Q68_00016013 [Brassica cretica]